MTAALAVEQHEVLIVGGGFGGIGMAIMLKRAGIAGFRILERGLEVGGVWRDNTYPGAACDVPSHLYSFSFEPNPDWSRRFASQDEIHAYLRRCADKYGLAPHLRCNAEVAEAALDEAAGLWRVRLRDGLDLNTAWVAGASSYLGMSVPGFPNFFLLYGPNTNLGHNSIVYMLESQFAHVLRALDALRRSGATRIEVQAAPHRSFNAAVQARLAKSAWVGCRSWYHDEQGRNTVNWPGFSLTYRWLTKHGGMSAYQLTRPGAAPYESRVVPPPSRLEQVFAAQNRLLLRAVFRPLVGPPLSLRAQRRVVDLLGWLMPAARKVRREKHMLGGLPAEVALPAVSHAEAAPGAILYLHGGAFCLGSPWSHRGLSTRLARAASMPVWTPDYRLVPEHPYPAALDDAVACYDALLASGLRADRIVIAGDSAGGSLAMALLLRLKARQRQLPAGAALLSPMADLSLSHPDVQARAAQDPMLRASWIRQALAVYACPPETPEHAPLAADLSGLPPLLIQAGTHEILLSDAQRLAAHAAACGVACRLEIFEQRWHVFQLQAAQLAGARAAIQTVAEFARERIADRGEGETQAPARHAGREEIPAPAAP